MPPIIGRFYYKLSTGGHLFGEYSNNFTDRALPESALRRENSNNPGYVGEYISSWYEPGLDIQVSAILTITLRESTSSSEVVASSIFSVIWSDIGTGAELFVGGAMLCDEILIGDYRSAPSRSND